MSSNASVALWSLLVLAGCDRSAGTPPAPTPAKQANVGTDSAAPAPVRKASNAPPTNPISVRLPGKKASSRPLPAKLGPKGPSTARTTSPKVYQRNLEAQRKGLEARLKRKPGDPGALARLAAWHQEQAHFDGDLGHALEAEALLTKAIAGGDTPALRKQRARVRAHLHRFDQANADLDAALKKRPKDGEALRAKGWNLHHQGSAGADALLDTPYAGPPSYSDHGREAVRLFEQGQIEAADQRLRRAHGAYPDVHPIPLAWIDLQRGLLRLRTGRHEEARRFFQVAYDRLPGNFVVAEHLAETEALLGNHARALELYDAVVEATKLPEFIAARAGVLREVGRTEDAAHALQLADRRWRVVLKKYGAALAGHAVGFWLEDVPRPVDAKTWAERSLQARRDPASLAMAARAAAAAKDSARARELLAEAEKHPLRVDEFCADLADAYHQLGDAKRAAAWLAKARELNPKTPGLE